MRSKYNKTRLVNGTLFKRFVSFMKTRTQSGRLTLTYVYNAKRTFLWLRNNDFLYVWMELKVESIVCENFKETTFYQKHAIPFKDSCCLYTSCLIICCNCNDYFKVRPQFFQTKYCFSTNNFILNFPEKSILRCDVILNFVATPDSCNNFLFILVLNIFTLSI